MLGAPRGKFKMAVSVTDFGIRCTHKAHRIIWRTANFCENLRLLGAPYGAENTVVLVSELRGDAAYRINHTEYNGHLLDETCGAS